MVEGKNIDRSEKSDSSVRYWARDWIVRQLGKRCAGG